MQKIKAIINRLLGKNLEVKIEPPDIVIEYGGTISLLRYLIADEIDYSVNDLSYDKLRTLTETFSELIDALPPGSEIKILKRKMSIEKLIRKLNNELLNLKATIDVIEEPHTKRKAMLKLKILESLYENIISGKPITRINLLVKIHVRGEEYKTVKNMADLYGNKVLGTFKAYYGINLRFPKSRELYSIIKHELGFVDNIESKPIIIEASRVSTFLPIPKNKKPSIEDSTGIPIGYDVETGWPVIIPYNILDKHMLVFGPTGRGKTTFLASLVESLISLSRIRVFALDFKGDLASILPVESVRHISPKEYPINILVKPDFFSTIDWSLCISDVLANTLGISGGDIVKIINRILKKGSGVDAKKILLDPGLSVLSPVIELMTNKPRYNDLVNVLNYDTVLDLGGYGTAYQNTYGGLIIHIFKKVGLEKIKTEKLLVIDEAWRVSNLKGLEELVKEGRSKHLGVVLATQNPSDIPREIIENTHLLVIFGSRNEDYIRDAEKMLGLPRETVRKLLFLGVGEAMMLNALDPHPIILRIRPPVVSNNKK